MIVRRIALFVALLFGLALTQLPEFVQQYRQALGGAIGELESMIAEFDAQSAQQGLSEAAGIDRLRGNADQLARERGDAIQSEVVRLDKLRDAQVQFRDEGALARLVTFASHYDQSIARRAYSNFEPAVPTSPEALALGLVGALFGGGVVHMTGHQMRRRRPRELSRQTVA